MLWRELDDRAYNNLKGNLMNPPALEYPNYQISFCLSIYKKVFVLRIFTQKNRGHQLPT